MLPSMSLRCLIVDDNRRVRRGGAQVARGRRDRRGRDRRVGRGGGPDGERARPRRGAGGHPARRGERVRRRPKPGRWLERDPAGRHPHLDPRRGGVQRSDRGESCHRLSRPRPISRRRGSARCSATSTRAQEGDHREDPAVVLGRLRQGELHQDAVDMLLDRALRHPQPTPDAGVRAAFGHQLEDLALARREALERVLGRTGRQELDDEREVDDRAAAAHAVEALEELVDVRDPALQQVAGSLPARQERRRVLDLDVGREDEDRGLRDLRANGLCRREPFRRMVRRRPDVDDGNVGPMLAYEVEQRRPVAGLTDDAVARIPEQAGEALAEQDLVLRDDDAPLGDPEGLALHRGSMLPRRRLPQADC